MDQWGGTPPCIIPYWLPFVSVSQGGGGGGGKPPCLLMSLLLSLSPCSAVQCRAVQYGWAECLFCKSRHTHSYTNKVGGCLWENRHTKKQKQNKEAVMKG